MNDLSGVGAPSPGTRRERADCPWTVRTTGVPRAAIPVHAR
jgi:hypothetical protein